MLATAASAGCIMLTLARAEAGPAVPSSLAAVPALEVMPVVGDSRAAAHEEATVRLPFGNLVGSVFETHAEWLGCPYAAPFERLRLPKAWSATFDGGRRFAQKLGPACRQLPSRTSPSFKELSEDCGTLNVYAPRHRPTGTAKFPVLVYLHGGSFKFGGSSDSRYNGSTLAARHGAVVVTVNYRLGPYGFLALREAPASLGILDQQVALRWVRSHIANFGGDPHRVLLFGQSAGAISSCVHLALPSSGGLFSAALLESGHCEARPLHAALTLSSTFCALAGCAEATADGVDCDAQCLREAPLTTWTGAWALMPQGFSSSWYPTVDGQLLSAQPLELLRAGRFHRVPLVIGANSNEGSSFSYNDFFDAMHGADLQKALDRYLRGMSSFYPDFAAPDALARAMSLYPPAAADADCRPQWGSALGDSRFVCVALAAARAAARWTRVYVYHFDQRCLPGRTPEQWGVIHEAEIPYVWGRQDPDCESTEDDRLLSKAIGALWTSFARTGTPTLERADGVTDGGGPFKWPRVNVTLANKPLESLKLRAPLPLQTELGWRQEQCEEWASLYGD